MKNTFFKLSAILFLLLLITNGCKKDETTPDPGPGPLTKVVSVGKQLTYFKIVTPAAMGIIDTVNKTVNVTVPMGTVMTSLVTDISIATGHTISPASGVAQNFSTPVVYTVKRPDNTTTNWTVTVAIAGVTVDQDITTSVTWTADKTYFINGDIDIENNAVLTIQPGTIIKFSASSSLSIGDASNGTIIANGTASNPIIFTSSAPIPAPGAWEALYFESHALNNCSLSYCTIEYAGGNSNYGALNVNGCDISVNHCTISKSGSYGVWSNYTNNLGGFLDFSNNTINTTVKNSMVMNAQKLGALSNTNTITSAPGILITGDFKGTTPQTWKNLGVPYIIDSEVDIDGTLAIEPGTSFRFESNGWFAVGYYTATTFTADGTSALPITFTSNSSSPVAGAWRGITIYDYTQTNSKMNYCIIDYAGVNASYGALHMASTSSIIFTNNIIRNSSTYGIILDADAGFVSFTGNTINTCANHLIVISTKHLPELGTPNVLTAATGKGILISGDIQYTNDVIWKKQTADYYVTGESDIDGNITIEPGCKFLFVNDSYFWFGYWVNTKLTAVGTSAAHITFTSAGTSPAAGAWRGIVIDSYVQTNSALAYCDFMYTGLNSKPAIYTESAVSINYTSITSFSSAHAAEYKTGLSLPMSIGNNFTWFAN